MKKFMIFLLMAFLYMGTCQARSESAHPNDAQLKLLSWVSPTPDQSFMTRSVTDDVNLVLLRANRLSVAAGEEVALTLDANSDAGVAAFYTELTSMGYTSLDQAYDDISVTWYVNGSIADLGSSSSNPLHGTFSSAVNGTYTIKGVVRFGTHTNTYESNTINVEVGTSGDITDITEYVVLTADPTGTVVPGQEVSLTASANSDHSTELLAIANALGYTSLYEALNNATVTWYVNNSAQPIGDAGNQYTATFSSVEDGNYAIRAEVSFGPDNSYESNTINVEVATPDTVSGLVLLKANPSDKAAVGQDVNLILSPNGAAADDILAAVETLGYTSLPEAYNAMNVTWFVNGVASPIGVSGLTHKLQGLFTPTLVDIYQIKAIVSFGVYTYESNTVEIVVGDTPGTVEDLSSVVLLTGEPEGEVPAGTPVDLVLSPNGALPAEINAALASLGYSSLSEAYNNAVVTWRLGTDDIDLGVPGHKLQGMFSSSEPGTYQIKAIVSFGPGQEYESNTVTIVVTGATPPTVDGLVLLTANPKGEVAVNQDVTLTLSPNGAAAEEILAEVATLGYTSLPDAYHDMQVTWYVDEVPTAIGSTDPLHKLNGLFTTSVAGTYEVYAVVSFGSHAYISNTIEIVVGSTSGTVEDMSQLILLTADPEGEVNIGDDVNLTLSPNGDHPAELYAALNEMGYSSLEEAYNNIVSVTWYVDNGEGDATRELGVSGKPLQGVFPAMEAGTYVVHAFVSFGPDHEYESNPVTIVVACTTPSTMSGLVLLTANPKGEVAVDQEVTLTLSPYGAAAEEILAEMATLGYTSMPDAYHDMNVTWYVDDVPTAIGSTDPLHKLNGLFTTSVAGTHEVYGVVTFGCHAYVSNTIQIEVGSTSGTVEDMTPLILLTADPEGEVAAGTEVDLVLSPNGDHPAELYAALNALGYSSLEEAYNGISSVTWNVVNEDNGEEVPDAVLGVSGKKLQGTFPANDPGTYEIQANVSFGSRATSSSYLSTKVTIKVLGTVPPMDVVCNYVEIQDLSGAPMTSVTVPVESPIELNLVDVAGSVTISDVEWVLNGTGTVEVMGNTENLSYTLPATVTAGDYTIHVSYHVAGMDYEYDCEKEIPLTVTSTEPVVPPAVIFANIMGNTQVCEDDEVTLTAMVTGDASTVTNYVWLYKENPVGTGPIFTFVPSTLFTDPADHKITLEVAYGADCIKVRDEKEIEYLPAAPEIHVSISANEICVGGQVTATIETTDPAWTLDLDNPIYSWYVNGVEVPGEHMGVITLNMPVAGAFGFAAKINTPMCGVSVQSEPDTVNVYDALPLTITGDNVVCQNASATMTATSIDGATYAWAGPDPAAATTTDNELTTTIPGVYAVTATLDGGCSAVAEFTVYQFGGDLQVTADQMNVCPGTPVILNANLDGWFNENIEYEWSDGLGTSSTVSTTVDATTTYYVTASVTNDEGNSVACQLNTSITINVVATDTVTTIVSNVESVENICLGQQMGYFHATSTVSDETVNDLSYIWYIDGIEIPGQNLNEIEPNFNEAGYHYISAKPVVSGCTFAPVSQEVVINVIGIPEITISGNNVICSGNTATMVAVANTNYYGNWDAENNYDYTYEWSDGTNGAELTTTEAGVYTVTATNTVTECFATASIEVTTFGGDLQVTASEMHVCPGTPVTLNANLDGWNNENITYEWSDGSTSSTISATVDATTTYTVTASTENATACQLISSITITATENENVTTTINADVESVCMGGQIVLTATDDTYSYVWYKNGVEIPGENQPSITVTPTHNGIYTFAAKAIVANCNTSEVSEPVEVNVIATPIVNITGIQNVVNGATNAELTASVLPEGTYTYAWSTGESTPQITVDQNGVYNVTVTSADGCTAISAPFQVNPSSPINITLEGNFDVCMHDDVNVTMEVDGDLLGNETQIRWLANGQYIEGQTQPTFSMSAQELYDIVKVTNFDLCAEFSLPSTCYIEYTCNPINIRGNVIPDHIVMLNNGVEAQNICEGAQLDLTVMVKDEEGGSYEDPSLTYIWTRNGVVIPGVHGSRFSEQAWIYDSDPVTYVYTAYIDFGEGCESEPVASTEVYVKRNPIVTIDGNPNVCYEGVSDMNVTLVAWVDGQYDQTATYKWYESGQALDNDAGMMNYYVGHFDPTYINPLIFTVEVTNGNGCSTIAEPFYVNVYDKPIVNISGDAEAVCTNGSVTLRANLNNYNDPMLVFQWYENEYNSANLIPGATHEIETFYPTEATTYVVAVTHLMDYNNPDCIGVDSFRVNINGIPQVTVDNDLDGATDICEGRSITFNATTTGGVEGEAIYTWYRNGVLVENVTGNLYVDAPLTVDGVPTTYIYSVIVNQGFSGCESVLTFFDTITVNPNPAITLVTDPIICTSAEGVDNVILTANMDVVPTGVQYRWLEDNVELAVTDTNVYSTHKDFSENPYNFSVQIVNGYGCTGEALATVYVNANPIVRLTTTDTMVCEGGTVTLAAALNDMNTTDLTYQWYDGTEAINAATGSTYTVTSAEIGTHEYHLVINQTTSGCQALSDTIILNVVAKPAIASVTEVNMPADRTVCDGYQVNLTANVEGGVQGGETYTWYRNGVEVEDATLGTLADVLTAENGETTTYTYSVVVAQATSGCVSEIFVLDPITVNPNPVLQLVTNPIVCNDEGDNITLTANLNPEMEGATFRWLEDNVEMDPATYTANENSITLHKGYRYQPYSFSVELVSELGCTAVGEALVYVNEAPVVNITASDNILCDGGEITLTASLNDWNATDLVYQWFDGDEAMDGATTLSYTFAPAAGVHNFHVHIIQQSSGCEAESDTIPVTVNGAPVIASVGTPQTSICHGGQLTITAAPEGGNLAGDTYTWYRNGILMEGATAATIYDTPELVDNNMQQFVYTAILTRPAPGCTSEAVTSDVVTVYPNPVVVITGDQHVCETDSVFLIANVDTFGMNVGGLHYTWYESGQIRDNMAYNLGDNSFFAEYMYARTEPYRFTVDVWRDDMGAGCISHSEEYLVYVYTQPVVNITATETEICENGQVTLTANLNDYNTTDLIYQWYTVGQESNEVAVGYDDNDQLVYETVYTTVYHNIPGATSATFTTNLTETSTLGVMVRHTPSNCWANDEITINVNPIPVVTDIVINAAFDTVTVCDGAEVTISAVTDAYNAEGAVYTWYRNGVEIAGVNGPVFSENVYTNNEYDNIYQYTAVVTLPASGCVSAISADAGVVIVGNSPASVVVSGNTVICDGGYTTLYANVVPAQPATYEWFKDNVSMNINTDNILVNAAGSYKVIANFNGCSTESEAVVVTVEQTPQIEVTAVDTMFCVGGNTTITAEATGWNNGNVNYNWSNDHHGSVYNFNPTVAGTYTFFVTASQATAGCVAVDSITINVIDLPVTPVVSVDNDVVCDGGQVTLTVTNADIIGNGAVYTWYRNGVVISNAVNASLTESPVTVDGDLTNYVYTVEATLPMSGCTSLASDNNIVTVIPTPVVTVSVDGNTTLCDNGIVTLHANVSPAGANYNYQWYKDNVLIPGANEDVYVASEDARETAYNYSVVVTANAGCNVTASAPAITFVAQPVVEVTISNAFSCVGGSATLTAMVDGGVANVNGLNEYSYQWSRNGILLADTTSSIITSTSDVPGVYAYMVTVTSEYGCQSTIAEAVTYTVIPDPEITIIRALDMPATVCDGGSTMLKAIVAGGYGDASYQWYKNGNILVGETNPILNVNMLSYGDTAVYKVEVIQSGVGCSNFAEAAINTLVTVVPTYTVTISGNANNNNNVCEGGTLTLNANVAGVIDNDALTYQWYRIHNGNNAVAIYGATNPQYSTSDLLLGNSYDYYVVVTSSISGCTVVSNSFTANVVAAPTVVINGANTVCEGGNLTLNAFVSGGVEGDDYVYTWSWTGYANGVTTTTTPNFTPSNLEASDAAAPYYFTVTISRNDNTGCTATSAAHEVNVLSAPSVTVTADNYTVCQNGAVTYTANVSPVGTYNYVWTIDGVQRPENVSTITVPMGNVGTINASVVVSAANASASCSATSSNVSVQVVGAPTVTLALDNNQMSNMCVGGVVSLTATPSVNSVSGNFNYEWIVDGTPVSGVINQLSQMLTNPGVHTYKVRVSMDNNLGCISDWSAPVTVNVAEQPVVALNSANGLSICVGGDVDLTGVVTNYGNTVNGVTNSSVYGNMTYTWTRNGVNVVNNTSHLQEQLNVVGNYSYQVSVDAAGYNCQPQASNIEVVNVVADPSWTEVHVYSNNGTDACLGEIVVLEAAIQGGVSDGEGSTNGHIQWVVVDQNGNSTPVSGGLGGSSYDIPAAAGTFTYVPTFVGNIGSGCQLSNTSNVQVAVTVHDMPNATLTTPYGNSICGNDPSASVALVVTFTDGTAPYTYEIVDGQGNVVEHSTTMANTATVYVAPTEQTTYRLNLIQDAFCENASFGVDAVVTVYVNSIEFDNTVFESGCDNPGVVTIDFTMISSVNPNPSFTVVYDNGMQVSGTISNNSATFAAPTVPGDYNAVFIVDGCSYDIVVRVLINNLGFGGTLPIMDQRWNDVVVVNNNPANNGGHTFVGFQWYKNGVLIPGAVYSNYQEIGGLNGFYSVVLVEQDANGNMVTYKTCEMYFNSVSTVKVYPVPANVRQEITLELDLTSEELDGAELDIYNVTGQLINHVTDLRPITKIEGFKAQGTYFGRILTGTNEIKTVKFIIVK
jgi:hypothetical protein